VQSKTIIDLLNNESAIHFIAEHIHDDVKKLAINAHKYKDLDIKTISSLILLYQKAVLKLPEHYKKLAALNSKSYEQCTSEGIAQLKAKLMNLGQKHLINITGGIGIDDWAMSSFAKRIDSCDIDSEIHELAQFNLNLFSMNNVKRHLVDGIAFIKNSEKVDCIYADPDRRPRANRVFRLEDSEPDILGNIDLLLEKSEELWIKISPMADITDLEKKLPSIQKIYVLAWHGEVKELLISCTKANEGIKKLCAINQINGQLELFEKIFNPFTNDFGHSGNYLYEPNRAIIKAGLSAEYCAYLKVKMLSLQSHFFVSDQLISPFFGRTFQMVKCMPYKPKFIIKYLEINYINKANISCRNFRETPEQLKVRFKLKDGGENYLFFTTDHEKKTWFYHGIKVSQT
jgi:hypothetical protein